MELCNFEVVAADGGKEDHELHCTRCGEHLCDVEPGDTLDVLVGVADNHVCAKPSDNDDDSTVRPPA